jgi:hypothetical protein
MHFVYHAVFDYSNPEVQSSLYECEMEKIATGKVGGMGMRFKSDLVTAFPISH